MPDDELLDDDWEDKFDRGEQEENIPQHQQENHGQDSDFLEQFEDDEDDINDQFEEDDDDINDQFEEDDVDLQDQFHNDKGEKKRLTKKHSKILMMMMMMMNVVIQMLKQLIFTNSWRTLPD